VSIETVKVPDIGGSEGVEVIEICVAVGDQVELEDSLVVLESDKASMEIPSPMAGKVTAIKISDGDNLSEGDVILEIEVEGSVTEEAAPEVEAETVAPAENVVEEAAPVAVAAGGTSVEVINVPDIGGAQGVDVIEVCVSAGDEVEEGDSLVVLETDKASMEIPAPKAGKVISVVLKEGDTTSQGAAILELECTSESAPAPVAAPTAAAEPSAPVAAVAPAVQPTAAPVERAVSSNSKVYAGPAVRLLARELGVNLEQVPATGSRGRIVKDDLKAFVKEKLTSGGVASSGAGIPAIPAVDFAKFGDVTLEPLSKIGKLTAANMQRSWLNVPHVTQFDDADITDLEDFRKSLKAEAERRGVKITPMPFLLKACATALRQNPKFNTSLHADGEHLVYKDYVHIGIAVDTPAGLMVPVIRDVDKKSIWELAAETAELAEKAKNKKLMPADMQGGCFTISSLGGIGGKGFTPIVNAPEVAILGVSKLSIQPQWNGSEFVPRKMLPMSVSYDHRAINGADGGRFFTCLVDLLADIRRLVL
jgi:pyruvate dehydrogenase E2 component (dihydrolipoamide acetyltransferase)